MHFINIAKKGMCELKTWRTNAIFSRKILKPEKSFLTLNLFLQKQLGDHVIKHFAAVIYDCSFKLERLSFGSLSSVVQCLRGWLLALPAQIRLGWKDLPGTNTPGSFVIYDREKFYNIGPWGQSY